MQQRRGDELAETAAQHLRHAKLRVVGGEHQIVTVHDAERAAEAVAVHLRDHDTWKCADVLGDLDGEVGTVPVEQRAVRHFAQEIEIEPRRIDGASALGDDDLERLVGADEVERFEEGVTERAVPAIALVRPVQHDARNAGVGEPFKDELWPGLERLPAVGHEMPPVLRVPLLRF